MFERIKLFIEENYKFLIFLCFLWFVMVYKLPYSIYTPGGAVNMTDRISGDNIYKSSGSFNMTYVSMVRGSLFYLGLAKVLPSWDIVPDSSITYEDTDLEETIEIDKIYMKEAISNAEYVAYSSAGIDYEIEASQNTVTYVLKDAKTDLKYGDVIISVDELDNPSLDEIQEYINTKSAGDIIKIKYLRKDKEYTSETELVSIEGVPKIGITIVNIEKYNTDFNIKVKTKSSESGPSGGFITALAIYNSVTENDITKGKQIMGTGTINRNGKIGEIGGVKYKLLGAAKKHADVFICPMENYEEAVKVKEEHKLKTTVIGASNFNEALEKLEALN